MNRDRHLDDAALIAWHYEPADVEASVEQHVRACARCAARGHEIAAALADDEPGWRHNGHIATSPARLEDQRQAILGRVRTLDASYARVIRFHPRGARPALQAPARAPHWRLAAAAAILAMIGAAAAGWVIETQRDDRLRAAAAAHRRPVPPVTRPATSPNQDALLSEIDMALARAGTAELRVLDALTPQGQDTPGRR